MKTKFEIKVIGGDVNNTKIEFPISINGMDNHYIEEETTYINSPYTTELEIGEYDINIDASEYDKRLSDLHNGIEECDFYEEKNDNGAIKLTIDLDFELEMLETEI